MTGSKRASGRPTDEELSAWLDGELEAGRREQVEAALRADPALRTRVEQLARVNEALAGAPVPPVSRELVARMRARLREEQRAEAARRSRGAAPRRRRTAGRRMAGGLAAAAAAVFALVWLTRPPVGPGTGDLPKETLAERAVDDRHPEAVPDGTLVAATPGEATPEAAPDETGARPAAPERTTAEVAPEEAHPGAGPEDALPGAAPEEAVAGTAPGDSLEELAELEPDRLVEALEAEGVSPEELGIALELDTLQDLPVIEQLELLERLARLEAEGGWS